MAVLYRDGDIVTGAGGLPKNGSALERMVRRCEILIGLRKGSFVYDRALGGDRRLLEDGRGGAESEEYARIMAENEVTSSGLAEDIGIEVKEIDGEYITYTVYLLLSPDRKGEFKIKI